MHYPKILNAPAAVILNGVKDLVRYRSVPRSGKILRSAQDDSIKHC